MFSAGYATNVFIIISYPNVSACIIVYILCSTSLYSRYVYITEEELMYSLNHVYDCVSCSRLRYNPNERTCVTDSCVFKFEAFVGAVKRHTNKHQTYYV